MNTYKRIVKKNKQIAPIINMLRAHILHGFLQLAWPNLKNSVVEGKCFFLL